jgi:hypothetical protein
MKYSLIAIFVFIGTLAKAQITEYNPAIGWKYVKSQELKMADGLWYNTEFTAETGYDYIFILNHKLDSAMASIQIFNLQDDYVSAKNRDTSIKFIDLTFDVKESGVYRVFFGINDNKNGVKTHDVQFMLVRRKKV